MKSLYLACILAATALTATAASAATPVNLTINTNLAGNFAGFQNFDGTAVLTGAFDFDQITMGTSVSDFSALFTQTGQSIAQNFAVGDGVTALYDGTNLTFTQNASTVFSFGISDLSLVNGGPPAFSNTTTNESSFQFGGAAVTINAGSTGNLVAVVPTAAAVPEPATWAMMLVGFGMVAGTARYRRRSTTAVYA